MSTKGLGPARCPRLIFGQTSCGPSTELALIFGSYRGFSGYPSGLCDPDYCRQLEMAGPRRSNLLEGEQLCG